MTEQQDAMLPRARLRLATRRKRSAKRNHGGEPSAAEHPCEHLRAVHPSPGGDDAAHDRPVPRPACVGVLRQLPISGASAGRLSDHCSFHVSSPARAPSTMASSRSRRRSSASSDRCRRSPQMTSISSFGNSHRSRCSSRSTATSTPQSRTFKPPSTRPRTSCRRRPPDASHVQQVATLPTRRCSRSACAPPIRCRLDAGRTTSADSVLAQKIGQVSGVGLVTLNGSQKPAVRVQVDPDRARREPGLSIDDVRLALVAANVNQAEGQHRR